MNSHQFSWPKATWKSLCLSLLSLWLIGWTHSSYAQDQKALFIVGNPSSLNGSDQAMKDWMETDMAYTVTVADDNGITESASDGHDIIFISSTVSSGNIGNTFTQTPIPLFTWEYGLFDDLGLTDPNGSLHTDYGMTSGSSIEFVNPTDPMSGGNSGTTAFFTTPTDKVWAKPNANATIIAQKPGIPDNVTYFRYDAGTLMYDGITAPATRGILPLSNDGATTLNITGFQTIKTGIQHVLPPIPPISSFFSVEEPVCFLEEPGKYQLLTGITLEDGSSVVMGSSTASPRVHHRYIHYVDGATNQYFVVDTIVGPPNDTVICQVFNVPGLSPTSYYIDCDDLDLSQYNITSVDYEEISDYDLIASRIKKDGTVMWSRSFGSEGYEIFFSNLGQNIGLAPDGNLLMTMGHTWKYSSPLRSMIAKLDVTTGDLLWSKYAPVHMKDDRTKNIITTSDDDLLTTGPSFNGNWSMHLQKLDQDANFIYGKIYYENGQSSSKMRGDHIVEVSDDNYLINGNTYSPTANRIKGVLVNVTPDGTTVNWAKRMAHSDPLLDDPNHLNFSDIKEHPLGGYVAVGYNDCGVPHRELLIARLLADGSIDWIKSYSHASETLFGSRIDILSTNDIVVTGYTSTDNFIAKVDEADGALDYLHTYTSTPGARPFSIKVTDLIKTTVITYGPDGGAMVTQFDIDGQPNDAHSCMINDISSEITVATAPIVLQTLSMVVANTITYQYDPLPMYEHFEDKGTRFKEVCPGEIPMCENDQLAIGSPSWDHNHIMNYALRAEVKDAAQIFNLPHARDVHQNVAYFDGLGRPIQSVAVQASPDRWDMVAFQDYDEFGRQIKQYLPFADPNILGSFRPNALTDQQTFFQSLYPGEAAFAETEFEASPLNRVIEQGAPGNDWQIGQHTIKSEYLTNGPAEVLMFPAGTTFDYDAGYYPAGELMKSQTINENGAISIQYTDKFGRQIMSMTQIDEGADPNDPADDTYAQTYYVYDLFGNVSHVLPPESVMDFVLIYDDPNDALDQYRVFQSQIDKWAFQYKYDVRQRVVEKKVPGAGWTYLIYNQLDQIVLTQDANQRANGKDEWSFTKYDKLSRPILTGIYDNQAHPTTTKLSRSGLQGDVLAETDILEKKQSGVVLDGEGESIVGYSNSAFPDIAFTEVHSVTYYDDYDFDADGNANNNPVYILEPEFQDNQTFDRLRGMVTGIDTKVLDPNQVLSSGNNPGFLQTVTFYDDRYRELQTQSDHLHGTDMSTMKMNFAGEILATMTRHTGPAGAVDVYNSFCYDHQGRLIRTTQRNNGDPEVVLSTQEYDSQGLRADKQLHSTDGQQSFLQSVDYAFNIRGWMTGINQTDDSHAGPGAGTADPQNDLFGMELFYNQTDCLGGTALFNGNISGIRWQQGIEDEVHTYHYSYDKSDRLIQADYYSVQNCAFLLPKLNRYYTSYAYDHNGNITSLSRYGLSSPGNFGLMDDLTYTYQSQGGNRLMRVDDAVTGGSGNQFLDGSNTGDDYEYDDNGNITKDRNKEIDIVYNHLNKPIRVSFYSGPNSGSAIDYVYDAAGTKLQMQTSGASAQTTDYINGFHYQDAALEFFAHAEGRVKPDGSGGLSYQYQIADHLGNSRVYFEDDGTGTASAIQIDAYYPFGLSISFDNAQPIANPENRYRYNGKEEQTAFGLGWYDYGARMYDATIGRWNGVDALANRYLAWSPYNYVMANPLRFIDPDGNSIVSLIEGIWDKTPDDGKIHKYDNEGNKIGEYKVPNYEFRLPWKKIQETVEYTVQERETVKSLARSWDLTEAQLRKLFNLKPGEKVAGKKLKINNTARKQILAARETFEKLIFDKWVEYTSDPSGLSPKEKRVLLDTHYGEYLIEQALEAGESFSFGILAGKGKSGEGVMAKFDTIGLNDPNNFIRMQPSIVSSYLTTGIWIDGKQVEWQDLSLGEKASIYDMVYKITVLEKK